MGRKGQFWNTPWPTLVLFSIAPCPLEHGGNYGRFPFLNSTPPSSSFSLFFPPKQNYFCLFLLEKTTKLLLSNLPILTYYLLVFSNSKFSPSHLIANLYLKWAAKHFYDHKNINHIDTNFTLFILRRNVLYTSNLHVKKKNT